LIDLWSYNIQNSIGKEFILFNSNKELKLKNLNKMSVQQQLKSGHSNQVNYFSPKEVDFLII